MTKFTVSRRLLLAVVVAGALAACSSEGSSPLPDAPPSGGGQPTWQLEDIQPQSTNFGQTYGLDTFGSKVVVVTLVEGY